jgi:outer membrane biosynthesis protein TonB
MSRLSMRTGVIFALVVCFALGMTAAAAVGWGGGGEEQGQDHGKAEENGKDHSEKGKEHGNGEKEHGKKEKEQGKEAPPTVTTPPTAVTTPPAPTPSAPVAPQAAPPTTTQAPPEPPEKVIVRERPPAEKAPPLAPVAERKQLASTGLNPALIAVVGMFCLAGGAFLFRRALVRD